MASAVVMGCGPRWWSTADLLDRAGAGCARAWDELIARYGPLVWSVLRRSSLDETSMADAYQTVWLRLFEHVDGIREPERLASWLVTTTRREAQRIRRAQQRQQPTAELHDAPDRAGPLPEDRVLEHEIRSRVRDAIDRIDAPSQHLLRLLYGEPARDYLTIAAMSGRPVGSIGPTRARVLAKVRRLVDDE